MFGLACLSLNLALLFIYVLIHGLGWYTFIMGNDINGSPDSFFKLIAMYVLILDTFYLGMGWRVGKLLFWEITCIVLRTPIPAGYLGSQLLNSAFLSVATWRTCLSTRWTKCAKLLLETYSKLGLLWDQLNMRDPFRR